MSKQLVSGKHRLRNTYWSLVGAASATILSVQPVMAETIWDRFSTIMRDIYGQLVGISTIVAVTVAAIALLVRMVSRNQRAVDEATSWLKRVVVTWIILNTLTKTQVIRLLRDKTPETAEKILRNLKREHQISDVAGGYYLALDGLCKPDQRTILAVWVLLRFIDYVDPMAHYPAVYPSQILFLKENTGYEIVVLYDGEQHLTVRPGSHVHRLITVLGLAGEYPVRSLGVLGKRAYSQSWWVNFPQHRSFVTRIPMSG